MKNLFRKSMFVLSFLGLFTFGAPKQAKAESSFPCHTVILRCPDGTAQYCLICDETDIKAFLEINCGIVVVD